MSAPGAGGCSPSPWNHDRQSRPGIERDVSAGGASGTRIDGSAHMYEWAARWAFWGWAVCTSTTKQNTCPSEMREHVRDRVGCTRHTYVAVLRILRRSEGNQRRAGHCQWFAPPGRQKPCWRKVAGCCRTRPVLLHCGVIAAICLCLCVY